MLTELGLLLREIRKKENETIDDMAKKINISGGFLSKLEIGEYILTIELFNIIDSKYNLLDDQKQKLRNFVDFKFEQKYKNDGEKIEALEVSFIYEKDELNHNNKIKIDDLKIESKIHIPPAGSPYLKEIDIRFIFTKEYKNIELRSKLHSLIKEYSEDDILQVLDGWKGL